MTGTAYDHDGAALKVVVTPRPCAVWVAIDGEIDLTNHDRLRSALSGVSLAGTKRLHFELSKLTFCDARGLWHLLGFIDHAEQQGTSVLVHGASRGLRRLSDLITAGRVRLDSGDPAVASPRG